MAMRFPFSFKYGVAVCLGWPVLVAASGPSAQTLVREAATQQLQALAETRHWQEPVFDVKVVTPDEGETCPLALHVLPRDTRQLSRMRFDVSCPAEPGWRKTFVVRAQLSAQVVVVGANVSARQPIAEDDLRVEMRDITATPDALAQPQDAQGKTSRRALRAGQVLRESWLEAEVLVQRGAAVQIVARSGGVQVTHAGESLENGTLNQPVKVRNRGSGKVIDARVIGRGMVEPVMLVPTDQSPD
jgi:flagella basal body P-ring formation protein FlgA